MTLRVLHSNISSKPRVQTKLLSIEEGKDAHGTSPPSSPPTSPSFSDFNEVKKETKITVQPDSPDIDFDALVRTQHDTNDDLTLDTSEALQNVVV